MDFKARLTSILINGSLEALFVFLIVLALLNKNNFYSKENLKDTIIKILVIYIIPLGIFSSILDYIMYYHNIFVGAERSIIKITTFTIILTFALINIAEIKDKKEMIKAFIFTFLSFVFCGVLELISVMLIAMSVNIDLEEFVSSASMGFLATIPERLIQYGTILFIYIQKNSLVQVQIYKLINENKILKRLFVIFGVFDFILLTVIIRYIFIMKVLDQLSIEIQLSIIVVAFSLIIINLLGLWITAVCIYPKEKYLQKYSK